MSTVKVQELVVFELFSLFLVYSIIGVQPAPSNWPKEPLVYIEWYLRLEKSAKPKHGMMYHIKKVSSPTMDKVQGTILPLSHIRQSCMLLPTFPPSVPAHWTTDSILNYAPSFYINNWLSKYSYQTIW